VLAALPEAGFENQPLKRCIRNWPRADAVDPG
jgi:hypothetical protein